MKRLLAILFFITTPAWANECFDAALVANKSAVDRYEGITLDSKLTNFQNSRYLPPELKTAYSLITVGAYELPNPKGTNERNTIAKEYAKIVFMDCSEKYFELNKNRLLSVLE